jgi:hypothetical protein
MFENLKKNGAEIVKGPESYPYGKFLWVMDSDGNKLFALGDAQSEGMSLSLSLLSSTTTNLMYCWKP